MKNFRNYILIALIGAWVVSCSEDDKLTVDIQDNAERGAVLRTIANDPNSFVFDDGDSVWAITIEAQDIEDGDLLSSVDVYVDFVDATPDDGTVDTDEALVANIPASAFSPGINGLPRTDYELSYGDALSALGLTIDPTFASDQINIRFTINLTDGRSITNTDLTGTVAGGSFFSSPLNYRANIVCPPKSTNDPGLWTIDMQDSFGDGWNGATLDIILDGEVNTFLVTEAQGATNTETLDVPASVEVLSIMYRSGAFDGENTFQVFSASGATVLDEGPSPAADVELLDYCTDF